MNTITPPMPTASQHRAIIESLQHIGISKHRVDRIILTPGHDGRAISWWITVKVHGSQPVTGWINGRGEPVGLAVCNIDDEDVPT